MGGSEHRLRCSSPAHHNVLNATAAFVAATAGSARTRSRCWPALASFSGTRRTVRAEGSRGRGFQVVDDYAHNAGKVAAVVETATQLVADAGSGRLVVVFQPHLYSRTRDFAAELGASLAAADVVVVMDVYAAREDPQPGVSGRLVAEAVRAARPDADVHYVPSWAAVPGWSRDCSGRATCSSPWGRRRDDDRAGGALRLARGRRADVRARGRGKEASDERATRDGSPRRPGPGRPSTRPRSHARGGPGRGLEAGPAAGAGWLRRVAHGPVRAAGSRRAVRATARRVRRRPGRWWRSPRGLVVLLGVSSGWWGSARCSPTRSVTVTGLADPGSRRRSSPRPGARRYAPGPGRHRRRRRPGGADPDRGVGLGEPLLAVDGGRLRAAQGAVLAVKNPQGQLQVVDATGVPFET
jgi:hypothetical protein